MKSLKDIALPITESEYREDGCMHYSTLTTYERGGVHSIPTLGDKKESSSLTFGSIVDCMITGTQEEFDNSYYIADLPDISDQIANVIKGIFNCYKEQYNSLLNIPDYIILAALDEIGYGKTWKPSTRIEKVKSSVGIEYYSLLKHSENKTLISSIVYNEAILTVNALKEAQSTSYLFAPNNPFEPETERLYQLKFRGYVKRIAEDEFEVIADNSPKINNDLLRRGYIPYTIMADEILVLHKEKKIFPIDLKTSSHYEDEFFKSFIDWRYDCQARSYAQIIKAAILADAYFKDFTIMNYSFVVVNKKTLTPMVWRYPDTYTWGTLCYGKNKQIECRHPFEIGEELKWYLDNPSRTIPKEMELDKPNDLLEYLNKL